MDISINHFNDEEKKLIASGCCHLASKKYSKRTGVSLLVASRKVSKTFFELKTKTDSREHEIKKTHIYVRSSS